MGALMTIVEHFKNAHRTPTQKIQIFSILKHKYYFSIYMGTLSDYNNMIE